MNIRTVILGLGFLALLSSSIPAAEQTIFERRIKQGTNDYNVSLRRDSDRRFKLVLTVPHPKDAKWRYSDLTLEVFDRNDRKLIASPAVQDSDGPLITVFWGPGGKVSFAIFMLGTDVPGRMKVKAKDDTFEVTFDPAKLPED